MWLLSNKVRVDDSGILEGFCDCHCHLLPGVDDGVQRIEETMHILQLWEEQGVKDVWMTPHIMEDYPNEPDKLEERFQHVASKYQGPVNLHLAAENMMDGPFASKLSGNGKPMLTLMRDYLLVETSYYIPPMNMKELVEQVKANGFRPILAHPERYQYMNVADYRKWKERGVLLQLNVPSLAGAYGPEVQHKAEWLLKQGMYDCCGTDTHSKGFAEFFLNGVITKKTAKKVMQIGTLR